MKFSLIFFVITISILTGVVGWFLLAGPDEEPHQSHREYVPPVTPTEPEELDAIGSLLPRPAREELRTVLRTVYEDVYAIYRCQDNSNQQAVLLTAQYQQTATGNNFNHAIRAVQAWEPYILQDLGSLLYPNTTARLQSSPELSFADVPNRQFRFAETQYEGQVYSVYYDWLLNYVIFAPTQACLERTMNNVYEVGA